MADDKKKKIPTDEEITRKMQDMLHGGEPRQFGQPVAEGFQAGEAAVNRSEQSGQGEQDSRNDGEGQKYDVDWLLDQYNAMQRDDEAEARRQKNRDMVNGIADMARAIGDLYHTNQYAPSQEVDKSLMSDVSRKRYDKAKAERDKKRAEWLHYVNNVTKQRNAEEGYRIREDANSLREQQLNDLADYRAKKLKLEEEKQADKRQFEEWNNQYKQGKLDIDRERVEVQRAYNEGRLSYQSYSIRMNKLAGYTKTFKRDSDGRIIEETRIVDNPDGTTTTTTTQKGSGKGKGYGTQSTTTTTQTNGKGKGY